MGKRTVVLSNVLVECIHVSHAHGVAPEVFFVKDILRLDIHAILLVGLLLVITVGRQIVQVKFWDQVLDTIMGALEVELY
mmetsp:Transcript_9906/g.13498  ORF Transcript_9906/g.13498 Transcript_9906/m.13498 type:complete len:80 (-) Transcript_9906:1096-1335(-)